MDTLYYSNYCKHSQKVLQFLVKGNLVNELNCLCIDKRSRDQHNNQMYIVLEDGKRVIMPPNVHSVPALLLVKQNYRVILGDEIISHFQPKVKQQAQKATNFNGEPMGISLTPSNNGMNIVSEQYTMYNLTPEELGTKGQGGRRQMYNYVSVSDNIQTIYTPPDNYQPDKVSNEMTVDKIQQKRNQDVPPSATAASMNSPFVPKL